MSCNKPDYDQILKYDKIFILITRHLVILSTILCILKYIILMVTYCSLKINTELRLIFL